MRKKKKKRMVIFNIRFIAIQKDCPESGKMSMEFLEENICQPCLIMIQPCLILCNPIDSSPPGSPIPGILQARTLEWVAISFSNA